MPCQNEIIKLLYNIKLIVWNFWNGFDASLSICLIKHFLVNSNTKLTLLSTKKFNGYYFYKLNIEYQL